LKPSISTHNLSINSSRTHTHAWWPTL
jgi:hypothetical protein